MNPFQVNHKIPTLKQNNGQSLKPSSTAKCNPNTQKQWTCDFIGYAINLSTKNSLNFCGAQVQTAIWATGQNTILQAITKLCRLNS
jgi:hypothetical protein